MANDTFTGSKLALLSSIETSMTFLGNHGGQLRPQDLARDLLEAQPRVERQVPGHSPKGR
jgi:hypothetical protein